jgi:hypothetical protein
MDPVTTSLVSRQDLAFNGLKQAAQQDQQAVQLVEEAAAESKAEPAGTVTATRGSRVNIVV